MTVFSLTFWKKMWKVLIASFMGFVNDNGLKLSAALAYYTVFSIAPLLLLIIGMVSIIFKDAFTTVFPQLINVFLAGMPPCK